MEKTHEELKAEATALGIDFKGNIKKVELEALIEQHYESQSAGDLVATQEDVEDTVEEKDDGLITGKNTRAATAALAQRLRKDAMVTKIVRITNTDKRDSSVTTTAYLSCENQFWGLSKIVPLDETIELEQCLIDVAKDIKVMNHVDEIIEGKRTGNKTFKMVNKYSVSFEDVQK